MLKKIFLSYSVSVFLLIVGIISLVQVSNPTFISNADSINSSRISVGYLLLLTGIIFILVAISLIVIKVITSIKKR